MNDGTTVLIARPENEYADHHEDRLKRRSKSVHADHGGIVFASV
jgi:hypothetical protein